MNITLRRALVAGFALSAFSLAAQAEIHQPAPQVNATPNQPEWVLSGAVLGGGDKLVREYNVSNGQETDSIRAGGLYQASVGALFPLDTNIAIQATIGLQRDSLHSNVDNGHAQFNKQFLEVIPFWSFDRQRVGLGITYFFSAKYHFNGDESSGSGNYDVKFDNTVAPTLAYDWFYNQNLALGLRASRIRFKSNDPYYDKIKGDNFGIQISWFL